MFKDLDFKDLGERCIATFVETFIGNDNCSSNDWWRQ